MSEKLFETILTRLVICVFFRYKSVERVQGAVKGHRLGWGKADPQRSEAQRLPGRHAWSRLPCNHRPKRQPLWLGFACRSPQPMAL